VGRLIKYVALGMFVFLGSCQREADGEFILASPDANTRIIFSLDKGHPFYTVIHGGHPVILPSRMGYVLRAAPDLQGPFKLLHMTKTRQDTTWETVWGQENQIRDHHRGAVLKLQEITLPQRILMIHFKAFDDGVAFRYEIPAQPDLDSLFILDELTQFNLAADGQAWWNDGGYLFDTPEQLYHHTTISEIDSANTPVTMILNDGLHLSIHEANLRNYPAMTLKSHAADSLNFAAGLVPWPDGDKVKAALPLKSPWRSIILSPDAAGLLESRVILNLNEPNELGDVSWIKPMTYMGIWWGMHINKYTWVQGERHGATTENAMQYIDFAASNGIGGVLVEGWNRGWEDWGKPDALDLLTPYDDFDLKGVVQYAQERGVAFIGHHETTANVASYELQMEEAYQLYHELGVHAVKSGYVGSIRPAGQFHYGQWMVEHFQRAVELAARYEICLDVHEPVKASGLSRTWPNLMSREGARGMEYNAWSSGNPPDHTTILPFTRLLAGPMDYTPGIFNLTLDGYKADNRVHTTLAKQLALMVVLYSPLQMAADLPESYEGQPAFQFIRDLKTDWDETRILEAEIGRNVTLARRAGSEWFIAAITNEESRKLELELSDILSERMVAEVYADGAGANWDKNPYPIFIGKFSAGPHDSLAAWLAPGGGLAIRLIASNAEDLALPSITHLAQTQLGTPQNPKIVKEN
jgi:alpha-glucosidase